MGSMKPHIPVANTAVIEQSPSLNIADRFSLDTISGIVPDEIAQCPAHMRYTNISYTLRFNSISHTTV